jgi:hypothetical protein
LVVLFFLCIFVDNIKNIIMIGIAIGGILKSVLGNKYVLLTIALLLLGLGVNYSYNKYTELKLELRVAKQNQSALLDSLRVSKNEVGDLVASRLVLIANHKEDVEALNSTLAKEAKKYKGEIHELTILLANIKHDTVYIDNTTLVDLPDGSKGLKWVYGEAYDEDNSRYLEGVTSFKYVKDNNVITNIKPLYTKITRDEINFKITQGVRTNDDGKVEVFASSTYPNFDTTELNSMIIDPSSHPSLSQFSKKKKWNFGFYAGYGATLNISTSSVITGPQLGFGIMYGL